MAGYIKTKEEIQLLRVAGKRHAEIVETLAAHVRPGVRASDIDTLAASLVGEMGDRAAFFHYQPSGAAYPYPGHVCVSVNDAIVHGLPTKEVVFHEGDIVSLDFGVHHKSVFTDGAITIAVGAISKEKQKLIAVTREALYRGIAQARPGKTTGDIGYAVESYVRPFGFGIIDVLAGHGVGREIHEDPIIPNFGKPGSGDRLREGMVLAIEPMITLGDKEVVLDDDGYTYRTKDGSPSAHFEHTVLVTAGDPEILTEKA